MSVSMSVSMSTAAQCMPAAHSLLDLRNPSLALNSSAALSSVSRSQQPASQNAVQQQSAAPTSSMKDGSPPHTCMASQSHHSITSPVKKQLTSPPSPTRPSIMNTINTFSSSVTTPPPSSSTSPPPLPPSATTSLSRSPPRRPSFWQTVLSSPSSSSLSSPTFMSHPSQPLYHSSQLIPTSSLALNNCSSDLPKLPLLPRISQLEHDCIPDHPREAQPIQQQQQQQQQQQDVGDEVGDNNEDMNIPCVICGVRFRKPGHLNMHWRSVHAQHPPSSGCVQTHSTPHTNYDHDNRIGSNSTNNVIPCASVTQSDHNTGVSLRPSTVGSMSSVFNLPFASEATRNVDGNNLPSNQFVHSTSLPMTVNGSNISLQNHQDRQGSSSLGYELMAASQPQTAGPQSIGLNKQRLGEKVGNLLKDDTKDNLCTSGLQQSGSVRWSSCSTGAVAVKSGCESKVEGDKIGSEKIENGVKTNGRSTCVDGGGVSKTCRAYRCPQCEASFRRGSDRNRHMRMVHAKIRPFECGICGNLFGRKSFLEAHVLTVHHKLRPFRCDCGAAFGQRSSLTRHARKIHGREPS